MTLEQALKHIGKGWHLLIYGLYATKPDDVRVIDVKEKFGTLRFYVDGATEDYYGLIAQAEVASSYMCEKCGNSGQIANVPEGSWIKTLCHKCWADMRDERRAKA
jgi:hypothetical protein